MKSYYRDNNQIPSIEFIWTSQQADRLQILITNSFAIFQNEQYLFFPSEMNVLNFSVKYVWCHVMLNEDSKVQSIFKAAFHRRMDEKTRLAIILGILVPTIVVVIAIFLVWLIRKVLNWQRRYSTYDQVNHELDEEEIEFKRVLDSTSHDPSSSFLSNKSLSSSRNRVGDEEDEDDYEKLLSSSHGNNNSSGNRRRASKSPSSQSENKKVNKEIELIKNPTRIFSAAFGRNKQEEKEPDVEETGEAEEDLNTFRFSSEEKNRLSILEKYRSNLMAEASSIESTSNTSSKQASTVSSPKKQATTTTNAIQKPQVQRETSSSSTSNSKKGTESPMRAIAAPANNQKEEANGQASSVVESYMNIPHGEDEGEEEDEENIFGGGSDGEDEQKIADLKKAYDQLNQVYSSSNEDNEFEN
jgi:hypothetical protein